MILTDMGAEVIKVEPPLGEIGRKYTPLSGVTSYVFLYLNRKRQTIYLSSRTDSRCFPIAVL